MNDKLLISILTIILILLFMIGIYLTAVYGVYSILLFVFSNIINDYFILTVIMFLLLLADILAILYINDLF